MPAKLWRSIPVTPDRWSEIERLYQIACEVDEQDRTAFLVSACADDKELRREIESLLLYEPAARRFLEAPVLNVTTEGTSDEPPQPPHTAIHPFTWLVWLATAVTLAAFIYAGFVLAKPAPGFGWTAAARGGIWYVESVDASGPAAGLLRRGDRLASLNGDQYASRAGPNAHRRALSIGDAYGLAVLRDGEQHEYRLTVDAGPLDLNTRLTWFLMSLVWCAIGLFVGFVRPGHAAARLAFAASLATGLLFLHNSVIRSGPLWAPLHVVFGFHFFLLFPTGVAPGGAWMRALYLMYGTGVASVLIAQARRAFHFLYGPAAATQLVADYSMVFRASDFLGLFAYSAALLAMLAVIPWNYRRLHDADQRRRVHWVALGSAIAVAGQLWWAAIAVLDLIAGPSGISRYDMSALAIAIPITVAYAVVKHRVFDVRVIIRRGVQYLLAKRALQALVAVPVVALVVTVVIHRDRTIAELVSGSTAYLYWIAAASLSLTFRGRVALWLDRKFFREEYDREQMLFGLVDHLGKVESIAEQSLLVSERLEFALHPKILYFWYRDQGKLTLDYSSRQSTRRTEFPSNGRLLSRLEQERAIVDISRPSEARLTAAEAAWLAGLGATLLIPIIDSNERLAGVWMLGERKSETPYSARDRQLLHAIAKQTAVLRENLRLKAQSDEDRRVRRDVIARLDRESFNLLKECPACGKCFDNTAECCDRDGHDLTTSLPVQRTIEDKYRLEQLIGKGGMGAVYEAHDLRLRRTVAVKIMVGRAFGQQTALRRFQREARAAASLSHPNIVSIFDFGQLEGEGAYLVMERLNGITLRGKLDRDGPMPPSLAAEWFEQLLQGLAAAHAQGILHRDLKPENIIGHERDGHLLTVKILDFGLAKFLRTEAQMTGSLTARDNVIGTLGYMPPERLLGHEADHRSDIYAVGIMLAEALTGRRPFSSSDSPERLLRAALYDTYELPGSSPEIRVLNELVKRCLAKEPQHRPASVAALQEEMIPALRAGKALGRSAP
jgi:GAF domain-containing protein